MYCPSIKSYSKEFNNQLADELDALPEGESSMSEAIKNYIYLRDRIRRCEVERDKING